MATYYYTKTEETKSVYHNDQNCSEGTKIESINRVDTYTIPAGRSLCEECGK